MNFYLGPEPANVLFHLYWMRLVVDDRAEYMTYTHAIIDWHCLFYVFSGCRSSTYVLNKNAGTA